MLNLTSRHPAKVPLNSCAPPTFIMLPTSLTMNILHFFKFVQYHVSSFLCHQIKSLHDRIREIVEAASECNVNILCLQEAWSKFTVARSCRKSVGCTYYQCKDRTENFSLVVMISLCSNTLSFVPGYFYHYLFSLHFFHFIFYSKVHSIHYTIKMTQ